jgi:hypothetical protein
LFRGAARQLDINGSVHLPIIEHYTTPRAEQHDDPHPYR